MSQEMARSVGSWIGQWYPSLCFFVPLLLFFPVALLSSGGNVYLSILLSVSIGHFILFFALSYVLGFTTDIKFEGHASLQEVLIDTFGYMLRMWYLIILSFCFAVLTLTTEYYAYGIVRWRNGLWQKFLVGYVIFSWGLTCLFLWALLHE